MAIAIASGATPVQGLYTAIVAGFLISALGGSRFQIGGPAGAFIVLVAATVQRHGMDGLFLATIMAGILMMAAGLLRLGTYIKFIPFPVTVGFTAGIAVIIATSQLRDLLGLSLADASRLLSCRSCRRSLRRDRHDQCDGCRRCRGDDRDHPALAKIPPALAGLPDRGGRRFASRVVVQPSGRNHRQPFWRAAAHAAMAVAAGDQPRQIQAVLPDAVAFALLGSIESLLSAVVADGMTGRRHRSNCELVAQGVANIASGLFGGICATARLRARRPTSAPAPAGRFRACCTPCSCS